MYDEVIQCYAMAIAALSIKGLYESSPVLCYEVVATASQHRLGEFWDTS